MDINETLNSLSLRERISQMFMLGFPGTELKQDNIKIQNAIKEGLGGVILFTENIRSYEQTANLTAGLQKLAAIPLFIGIDQEGGKIERTGRIKNKINYRSPATLASEGNPDMAGQQAKITAKELKSMGVNMNFAPVLDVNTNPHNPIIGERAFSNNPQTVINFARPVYETFLENGIIPVVKHFPGHGHTAEDSHHTMPCVDLGMEELETTHIAPFKTAFSDGVNAVIVAHANYKAFDAEMLPASLSQNVIKDYLRGKMRFNGLVISDDMVMGGVKKYCNSLDACVKGINAGIDAFVFRNCDDTALNLSHKLVEYVENGVLSEKIIDESVRRILACKSGHISV